MDEIIKNVSVSVNLNEGNVVISGPESFVEKNMLSIFEFVERNRNGFVKKQELAASEKEIVIDNDKPEQADKCSSPERAARFLEAGILHIDSTDNTISILKKVPGNSKAEKARNIALIVLYVRKEKIEAKDIIPICEKHNCYDKKNFAAVFKREKTNILYRVLGKNVTLELTQPGEEAALELLEGMMNEK